jgi:putative tryptophan/tyrosine transport system substrate-binding protein
MAEQGGLIGYGPRISDTFRTLGRQLVKILRGTNPRRHSNRTTEQIRACINLRSAKEIGLEISADFVLRANKLIE